MAHGTIPSSKYRVDHLIDPIGGGMVLKRHIEVTTTILVDKDALIIQEYHYLNII